MTARQPMVVRQPTGDAAAHDGAVAHDGAAAHDGGGPYGAATHEGRKALLGGMSAAVTRRTALRAALASGLVLPLAPALARCSPGAAAAVPMATSTRARRPADPTAVGPAVAALTAAGGAIWAALTAAEPTANSVFSPYSLERALAMVRFGAKGPTGAGLDAALATTDHQRLAAGLGTLAADLASRAGDHAKKRGGTGHLAWSEANAVWAQRDLTWEAPFLDALAEYFGTGLTLADYRADPAAAIAAINAWCAAATQDLIERIVGPNQITRETRLVLANAVYLKADWNVPFEKSRTRDEPFARAAGGEVRVPMMYGAESVPHRTGAGWQAASIPYVGGKLARLVVLPDRATGAEATVPKLVTSGGLGDLLRGWDQADSADLVMPRFRIESTHDLAKPLIARGAGLAFGEGGAADLTGLTTQERLELSFAIQKATIVVDEEGTEAAAVSAVGAQAVSARIPPPVLRLDRPFYAVVYDAPTATPLFLTYVTDPSRR